MKILITGCAGFIGSNLSRALLKLGHAVYGIDDLSVGNKDYLPKQVRCLYTHQLDHYSINKLKFPFESLDFIIHLASRKIPREGRPDRVLKENALCMMNVVNMAKKFDAKIIFLSSSEVYGLNPMTSENSTFIFGHPENVRWSYGLSKAWCENYLFGTEGIRFNIIRLFATYGPWNCRHWRAGPIPVFIEQALNNETITLHGGSQTRCFQYIDDAIDGILSIIKRDDIDRKIYNIGNPYEEISIAQLAYKIYELIDPINQNIRIVEPCEIKRRVPTIRRAVEDIAFKPVVKLEEGLKKTIEWHRSELGKEI